MSTYLIIGGSSGIGNRLSNQLAKSGSRVFATYNRHKVESDQSDLSYHHCDVTASDVSFDFLPEAIDGLAYCPGSIQLRPFPRINIEDLIRDFELQVAGAFRVIKAVLPHLKASGNASVVMFSTVAVQVGFPFHSQVAASKGAIEGLTRSLAAELSPGIRVNCIAPSLTDTPLAAGLLGNDEKRKANAQRHPLKKIGQPEDLANMAQFLLSGQSAWITGQVMHVDGGISTIKT